MTARSTRGQDRCRQVTECCRERQTYKYYSSLRDTVRLQSSAHPIPSAELSTSEDAVLTALAQLGACQTGADRALISLFDSSHQYVIAEATRASPLQPSLPSDQCAEPLWLCGTAIPRSDGICEHSLLGPRAEISAGDKESPAANAGLEILSLTISQDLADDVRFASKPFCQAHRSARFYAAVPIRTKRGINIGVYCVIKTCPSQEWSDAETEQLREVSRTIMAHLEIRRARDTQRRNERMNRGLGSFMEGRATVSGWRGDQNASAFRDKPGQEGGLNARQQTLQRDEDQKRSHPGANDGFMPTASVPRVGNSSDKSPRPDSSDQTTPNELADISTFKDLGSAPGFQSPASVFSKAANIIRESIEVEGCLFFDATMGAYGTPAPRAKSKSGYFAQSSTGSSDDSVGSSQSEHTWPLSELLGFSTSESASIDGLDSRAPSATMGQKVLTQLLRRYPRGKIFNFDANGELQSSDSSEDEHHSADLLNERGNDNHKNDDTNYARKESPSSRQRRSKKPWLKQNEGSILQEAFPGARSVIFVPVWDARKDRWYAGGFVYTRTPHRVFTLEGELSYLRAFGMLAAGEIVRFSTLVADKAKSDALGSLSHELRSPLHGVLLSAELLIDTDLDAFQSNAAHTVETCARTLLDTIDHLLDYSKINNFAGRSTAISAGPRGIGTELDRKQFGKKNLRISARLDGLVEEVVESVFAGFNFQHSSLKQQSHKHHRHVRANQQADSSQAMEQLGADLRDGQQQFGFGDIKIVLSIDPTCNWLHDVQVGAIRRIVMNLFGNALKYTQRGYIRVSLTQEMASIKRRRKRRVVKLVVQDTGKGIGTDYLEHGLYKAFSQEDELAPGTGLGLSLVKQITTQLRGQISLQSQVGVGTTFTVMLPLEEITPSPTTELLLSDDDKAFAEHVQDLKGLRVRIKGPQSPQDALIPDTRRSLEETCRDWLQMQVLSGDLDGALTPDLVLWQQDTLPTDPAALETLVKTPNVVICSNALVAHQQFRSFDAANQSGIFEFISQPQVPHLFTLANAANTFFRAGPRKLAKTLLVAFRRWMGVPRFPPDHTMPTLPSTSDKTNTLLSMQAPPLSTEQIHRRTSLDSSVGPTTRTANSTCSTFPSSTGRSTVESAKSSGELDTNVEPASPSQFLLVDDNYINLKILSSYMKRLGLEYNTAANGQEALEAYVRNPGGYTCILMDISMPIMNGFEATRCIRAYEMKHRITSTPIIALSGLASEDAQQEAFGSGMDLFLTKPVRLQLLGKMLRERGMMG